ncbi:hypothetical protein [Alkalibacterium thalassium]|uniref:Uncharacterized protein n=1 Tax=Alkalibacterium thalassium TaxID=426701 RepID=A0A1G9FMB9_9LACT|nr:hypothetical protein [Alkalibacterium thalassium]SDK89530.1 hypothetical protein SAMN04488098_10822 [Alkalibacterium thalassium]
MLFKAKPHLFMSEQDTLLNAYPPSEQNLNELEEAYADSLRFIPEGETINEAIVLIQSATESNDVTLRQISRLNDEQPLEGLNDRYVQTVYQVEFESSEASNIRGMLVTMNQQDRLLNSYQLSYQRESEDVLSGSVLIDVYYHTDSVQ